MLQLIVNKKVYLTLLCFVFVFTIASGTVFSAEENVTRIQIVPKCANIVAKYYRLSSLDINEMPFSDVTEFASHSKYLKAYKVISGTGATEDGDVLFEPDRYATKEESAVIFARTIQLILHEDVNNETYITNDTNVSDWAKNNFGYMKKTGLLPKSFISAPKAILTKSELEELWLNTKNYISEKESGKYGEKDYLTKEELALELDAAYFSYKDTTPFYYSQSHRADLEHEGFDYGILGLDDYKPAVQSEFIGWYHPATKENLISSLGKFFEHQIFSDIQSEKCMELTASDISEIHPDAEKYWRYFVEKNVIFYDEEGNLNPKQLVTKSDFTEIYVRVATLIENCHDISCYRHEGFDKNVWKTVPPLEEDIPDAACYLEGNPLDILCTHY